ncbi:hypothetical protein SNL152K_1187 [Streptomyces sp. NL15-2K]|nr:hypothetical protein SNL152K_1187 [Streptomyces sp. NL15-2K]
MEPIWTDFLPCRRSADVERGELVLRGLLYYAPFGGSLHCVRLDTRRRGTVA